jgi:hypothetical protein
MLDKTQIWMVIFGILAFPDFNINIDAIEFGTFFIMMV